MKYTGSVETMRVFLPLTLCLGVVIGITAGAWATGNFSQGDVWPKSSQDWAAWVQAVGSIAAIIAAFGIAWWQLVFERRRGSEESKRTEVEKRTRAYALSCLIRPDLEMFGESLAGIRREPIAIPEGVRANIGELHVLGETAGPILEAVGKSYAYNRENAINEAKPDQIAVVWTAKHAPKRRQEISLLVAEAIEHLNRLDAPADWPKF